MAREPSHANPFHRYTLPAPAHLLDAEERRYVRIAPTSEAIVVDHGTVAPGPHGAPAHLTAVAPPPERFAPNDLAAAVQRLCALAATWLSYDEWEVEQTRRLFLDAPSG